MYIPSSSITRRQFSLTSLGGLPLFSRLAAEEGWSNMPWTGPSIVRRVYLANKVPGWPRPDVDLKQDIAEIEAHLSELQRRLPGEVEFTGGELLFEGDDIAGWMKQAGDADVILAFNMSTGLGPILEKVLEAGRPVLLFARLYAGHSWTNFTAFSQAGRKADVLASSEFADLDPYVNLFRTIHHMRRSKVLLVSPSSRRRRPEGYTEQFGTSFAFPDYSDLKAAYQAVDAGKARSGAEEFMKAAQKVVEPSASEVVDSMRMYMAIKEMLRQEKANAIAIDCLGGFGRGDLVAYPCIAFSKLNDQGLYGVCECDLHSTMTQLLVTSFSGKPGFVSDPVFDTSRNEVIHAHCVAATQMRGIGAPASPFIIRSHLEDHKGVSLQVLVPAGGTVTVARFADPKKLLLSTGEALGNVDHPRGCRTKIRTRVSDARKFLDVYSSGLHRVVFYGDHVWPIERLGRLTGFQVVHEI